MPETPETAKVPAELIDILGERIHDGWHEGCEETGCNGATRAQAEEVAHDHLAAVLPALRAMVADEIVDRHLPLMPFPDPEYVRGLMDAARIARGEQP